METSQPVSSSLWWRAAHIRRSASVEAQSSFTSWAAEHGAAAEEHTAADGSLWAWSATGQAAEASALAELRRTFVSIPELMAEVPSKHRHEGVDVCSSFITGPAAAPGPKAFAFDVDSTLIEEEVIELLAERAGRRREVAEVTAAAMRGELDFEQSLRARVSALAGLPLSVIQEVAAEVTPSAGALGFIAAARAAGHTVGAVSGGFSQVLDIHADEWGLSTARANALEIADGRLTGSVTGDVVTASVKRDFLLELGGPSATARIAVGDGANDLDMVTAAHTGVAFCAKPILARAAEVRLDVRHLGALAAVINLD